MTTDEHGVTQEHQVKSTDDDQAYLRCMILPVDEQDMLAIIRASTAGLPGTVTLPHWPELPDGVVVQAVHYEVRSRCFLFRLQHESFAVASPYTELPWLQTGERQTVRLAAVLGETPSSIDNSPASVVGRTFVFLCACGAYACRSWDHRLQASNQCAQCHQPMELIGVTETRSTALGLAAVKAIEMQLFGSEKGRPSFGRNRPCFCGSGKKFKFCCLHNRSGSAEISLGAER